MKRLHLFEWEDLPWFPHRIRNYMTDLLQFTFTRFAHRAPVVAERLGKLLDRAQTDTIVDLCSGSSGALVWFRQRLEETRGKPVRVILTDKYPNLAAFRALKEQSGGRVDYRADSIDATALPEGLDGVRTLFFAFHHFPPEVARRILADAAEKRQAIAIFEGTERRAISLLVAVLTIPVVVLIATLFVRPVRLGRLFWTYLIPIVPLAVWWDGVISCLRSYTPEELEQMAASIGASNYTWEAGSAPVKGTPGRTVYLIGYTRASV